jgi:hypothetical protein
MPTYEFLNKNTGLVEEHILKLKEYDSFKLDNPHLERTFTQAPGCCDPVIAGVKKPAAGFRDLLKNMKKKSGRRSTINDW